MFSQECIDPLVTPVLAHFLRDFYRCHIVIVTHLESPLLVRNKALFRIQLAILRGLLHSPYYLPATLVSLFPAIPAALDIIPSALSNRYIVLLFV